MYDAHASTYDLSITDPAEPSVEFVDHVVRAAGFTPGKSDNEIRRSLKRYIARERYRTLEATSAARQHIEASFDWPRNTGSKGTLNPLVAMYLTIARLPTIVTRQ